MLYDVKGNGKYQDRCERKSADNADSLLIIQLAEEFFKARYNARSARVMSSVMMVVMTVRASAMVRTAVR
jgi:hypothetical protein